MIRDMASPMTWDRTPPPTLTLAHGVSGRDSILATRLVGSYVTADSQLVAHLSLELRVHGGQHGGDVLEARDERRAPAPS